MQSATRSPQTPRQEDQNNAAAETSPVLRVQQDTRTCGHACLHAGTLRVTGEHETALIPPGEGQWGSQAHGYQCPVGNSPGKQHMALQENSARHCGLGCTGSAHLRWHCQRGTGWKRTRHQRRCCHRTSHRRSTPEVTPAQGQPWLCRAPEESGARTAPPGLPRPALPSRYLPCSALRSCRPRCRCGRGSSPAARPPWARPAAAPACRRGNAEGGGRGGKAAGTGTGQGRARAGPGPGQRRDRPAHRPRRAQRERRGYLRSLSASLRRSEGSWSEFHHGKISPGVTNMYSSFNIM